MSTTVTAAATRGYSVPSRVFQTRTILVAAG
jgi:hypothetical protein